MSDAHNEAATLHLRLYVMGNAPKSRQAVEVATRLCRTTLLGRSTLDVVDLRQNPERTRDEVLVGVPTLVRLAPKPQCRIVGRIQGVRQLAEALGVDAGSVDG